MKKLITILFLLISVYGFGQADGKIRLNQIKAIPYGDSVPANETDPVFAADSAQLLHWADTIPANGIATKADVENATIVEVDPHFLEDVGDSITNNPTVIANSGLTLDDVLGNGDSAPTKDMTINVLNADSVHANWFGGTDTKIGLAGSKLTIDMDSTILTSTVGVSENSRALVGSDSIYAAIARNEGGVTSVNGEVGVVVLTTGDITEDTDKNYVTDAELAAITNNGDSIPVLRAAIDLNTTHRGTVTGNPHVVTATNVGLGSVENAAASGLYEPILSNSALINSIDAADTTRWGAGGIDVTLAGTPDYLTIDGSQVITRNQIVLTTDVVGVLPIANIATGTPDGTKFVRDDGTLVTPSIGGDVSKVGTPVDNQIGVWTGDGTIEGSSGFTYTGNQFLVTGSISADYMAVFTPGAAGTSGTQLRANAGNILNLYDDNNNRSCFDFDVAGRAYFHHLTSATKANVLYIDPSTKEITEGAAPSGSGDVTAASAFGTDNVLIKSDGTGKGVQATGLTLDDSNNLSGLANITSTGNISLSNSGPSFTFEDTDLGSVNGQEWKIEQDGVELIISSLSSVPTWVPLIVFEDKDNTAFATGITSDKSITAEGYITGEQTVSTGTQNMNWNSGANGNLALTANSATTITNLPVGGKGHIIVTNDASAGETFTIAATGLTNWYTGGFSNINDQDSEKTLVKYESSGGILIVTMLWLAQ